MSDGRSHRTFTFENGITVELRRVPPLTMQEFGRQYEGLHPRPTPPMQEVDYGAGKTLEANESHPAYLSAVGEYESAKARQMMDFILMSGVKCDIDAEAVAAARASMAEYGMSLPDDDRRVYIQHVLIGSAEELVELRDAILLRGQPTEAAIERATKSVSGDVQRATA